MRICHLSPHLPPDQAANALLPATLGAWMREDGDDVSFVAVAPAQGRGAAVDLAGPVIHIPARGHVSTLARLSRWHTFQRARTITAALDRMATGCDLLHLHSNGLIIEVAAAWARRHNVPHVLTLYGTEIWHYRRRWPIDPFTRAYRSAGEVTFYSQGLLDRARELGLERPGLSVIYPAVSSTFSRPDDAARAALRRDLGVDDSTLILNVKRLHELAGQQYLVDAFAALAPAHPSARLVVCGTGPLRTALEAQARARGIAERVHFAGLVSNDEVARYAAAADVFALPSLLEALPTVAVEALAAGTPVVSADHPGGVELHAIFGRDVRLVPKTEVRPLADALADAIDAPRRTDAASDTAVLTRFSPAAIRTAYRSVYERVLKTAPRR